MKSGLVRFHRKAKPGLQHMILAGDVMAEMAKALFDPAAVHHMHATKLGAHGAALFPEGFEHMPRHIGGNIKLPAKLAHIGHAVDPGEAHADLDLLRGAERIDFIGEIRRRDLLQEVARIWPHHRQHAFAGRHIGDHDPEFADMAFHPGLIGPVEWPQG